MTRSKLTAAMVAGFLMGQAFGPCDRVALHVPCGCEHAAATGAGSAPARVPDGRTAPSRARQSTRRGGAAHHFIQCDAASADAAVR
jgi:hypothetical protein